jgi:preprotein translocase subunit YajC
LNSGFLIILVLGFAAMWLLFIRPQKRRQQAQRDMLDQLEPGDEILTAGGFYGTIRDVGDDEVTVELAPGMNVRMARRAVAAVIPPDAPEDEEEDEEPEGEEELEEIGAAGSRPDQSG